LVAAVPEVLRLQVEMRDLKVLTEVIRKSLVVELPPKSPMAVVAVLGVQLQDLVHRVVAVVVAVSN
jgi:hypothetical protein